MKIHLVGDDLIPAGRRVDRQTDGKNDRRLEGQTLRN
jgi:hypothetical protein